MTLLLLLAPACVDPPAGGDAAAEEAVAQLDPVARAVRISLDLRGVRPTLAELDAVEADPGGLDATIEEWLHDDRFEGRVRDLYNEIWITRVDAFPVASEQYGIDAPAAYAGAIAEEPLRILGRVAALDRPWTDLVTADWSMADEMLGSMWPVDYPEGATGWQVVHYTDGRPAAGMLATNGLWWRYRSTDSNGNRKRANTISRALLCSDYLVRPIEFDRDIDLLDQSAVDDALRTQPACVNCHVSLDPIASYLFGFSWYNWKDAREASYYWADREEAWRDHTGVPPAWYGQPGWSLADLGPQIANDPRFVSCAVEQAWRLLLRRPSTLADTDALTTHREAFLAGGLTLRALWRSVVSDPRYLAADVEAADGLEGAVPARLVTPDLLGDEIEDLTGFRWTSDGWDLLRSDVVGYRTLAGGADGYNVQSTATGPTATLLLVHERLAEAAAWHVVAEEPERLFGATDPSLDAEADPAAARALLVDLHRRLYGERPTDAEQAEDLALWSELYALDGDPRAAWAGVVSALLRDPRLLVY